MSTEMFLTAVAAAGGFMGGMGAFFNGLTAMRVANRVAALGTAVVAKVETLAEHVAEVKTDVAVVKKQGNHTQDILVALTEREAHARGKLDQAAETAAIEAKGV